MDTRVIVGLGARLRHWLAVLKDPHVRGDAADAEVDVSPTFWVDLDRRGTDPKHLRAADDPDSARLESP